MKHFRTRLVVNEARGRERSKRREEETEPVGGWRRQQSLKGGTRAGQKIQAPFTSDPVVFRRPDNPRQQVTFVWYLRVLYGVLDRSRSNHATLLS